MNRLRDFLRLPAGDRQLLISAALLLGAIALGVRLLSFRTLRRFLERLTKQPTSRQEAGGPSACRVIWAVTVAGRYVPGGSACLPQALTAQVLLARRGAMARLRIGVARERGRFQAHAWLENDGQVLLGGPGLVRYAPLPALDGERR